MQTQNLNVTFNGQPLVGFEFSQLPMGAAILVASQQIDQAADQARLAVMGDPLRALEYQTAADEAQAFTDAGYAGEAPPTVQAWMDAADLVAQEAAENILAEAAAWKGALYQIRAVRLKAKQGVLKVDTHDQAESIANGAIEAIKACVEGVGNAV